MQAISYFHKLFLRTYGNKLKTTYEHVINCFHTGGISCFRKKKKGS